MSNSIGGLLFGAGMVLAGGCSGSTWYRRGEGAVGAWVILLGFAMSATTVRLGSRAPLRGALQAPVIPAAGAPPTLATVLGVSPWLVIAALWILGGIWLLRSRGGERQHGKWPCQVTGAAAGALIAAGWWASTFGERPVGPSFAVNTGLLTYPLADGRTRGRFRRRVAVWRFPLEVAARVVAGEDLLRRVADARLRHPRRGMQHHAGPDR
jgi:hypothetical protein